MLIKRHMPILFLLTAFLLSAACSRAPRWTPPEPAEVESARTEVLAQNISGMYPEKYRVAQRVVIKAFEREFDFVAYLLVVRGSALRVQFLGEMGGTVLDLAQEGERGRIFKKPDGLPSEPLLLGALGDMVFMYDPSTGSDAYLARGTGEEILLVASPFDEVYFQYAFDPPQWRPIRWSDAREGRLLRTAELSDFRIVEGGWDHPVPTRIHLENHRYNYTVDVQVLGLKPGIGGSEE
ncbi:MAG: hypothetical protein ACOC29_03090 [Candidatus Sumerlaeota bacterium]